MHVKLISHTSDALATIEEAASVCYDSTPSKSGRIMKECYISGHLSVLEHASFTFKIEGISRACLAQLTRHRLASMTVRSQRYCLEDNSELVMPPSVEANADARDVFTSYDVIADGAYRSLLALGIKPEDARSVLPNAMPTTLVFTVNLRELIHIMNERLCFRAQTEIRELAGKMRKLVLDVAPYLDYMLVPKCEIHTDYPFCTESKRNCCGRHPRLEEIYHADK